uniref:Uncharacterized protein n=1 Tax=Physcomitrium patens TaxID=3218 RepID=A0A7I4CDZ5_PHYPA
MLDSRIRGRAAVDSGPSLDPIFLLSVFSSFLAVLWSLAIFESCGWRFSSVFCFPPSMCGLWRLVGTRRVSSD